MQRTGDPDIVESISRASSVDQIDALWVPVHPRDMDSLPSFSPTTHILVRWRKDVV